MIYQKGISLHSESPGGIRPYIGRPIRVDGCLYVHYLDGVTVHTGYHMGSEVISVQLISLKRYDIDMRARSLVLLSLECADNLFITY